MIVALSRGEIKIIVILLEKELATNCKDKNYEILLKEMIAAFQSRIK